MDVIEAYRGLDRVSILQAHVLHVLYIHVMYSRSSESALCASFCVLGHLVGAGLALGWLSVELEIEQSDRVLYPGTRVVRTVKGLVLASAHRIAVVDCISQLHEGNCKNEDTN